LQNFRFFINLALYHFNKEYRMKVRIDADLCTGCALCTDSLPEIFTMGDDVAEVAKADVPGDQESAVQEAADDCPAEAIIID
jgi:ferredoxin